MRLNAGGRSSSPPLSSVVVVVVGSVVVVVVELITADVVEEDSVGVALVAFSVEVASELEDTLSPPSLEGAIEFF